MPASRRTKLLMILMLAVTTSLMAQTRNGGPRRNQAPQTRGTTEAPPATPEPAEPSPSPKVPSNGAGTVIPPNQGYYVNPPPTPPGTTAYWGIPDDPVDRAYWELYDPEKSVTLSGKVSRVDWTMPNSYVYLSAEGALWAVESPYVQFLQSSITPAIRVGDLVTITGYFPRGDLRAESPARYAPSISAFLRTNHLVRAGSITTGSGQRLQMGRPPSDSEMAERLKCSPFGC
jgi:hypothetical protein